MFHTLFFRKRNLRRAKMRQGLALALTVALLFGLVPSGIWQPAFLKTPTANGAAPGPDDLERLLQQPLPAWDAPEYQKVPAKSHTVSGVQVVKAMPDLQAQSGGGSSYLSVEPLSTETFSRVGKGTKSVTFKWNDHLADWIQAQSGTPENPPDGYNAAVYVRNIKTKEAFLLRGQQEDREGANTFVWTGNNAAGKSVPDGVYEWYIEAADVQVVFKQETEDVTKTAPAYNKQYGKITLDREAPEIIAAHGLGLGYVGLELRDAVSGLEKLITSGTPSVEQIDDEPLRAIIPVKKGTTEQLSFTARDAAGNEISDKIAVMNTFAHMGNQTFWPKADGKVAGLDVSITLHSGNGFFQLEGFRQSGIGPDMDVSLAYNHQNRSKGLLGYGWTLSLDSRLTKWADKDVTWLAADGSEYWFDYGVNGEYTAYLGGQAQAYPQLEQNTSGEYSLLWADQTADLFSGDGRLIEHQDRYGNKLTYTYEAQNEFHGKTYRLKSVAGSGGKTIELQYDDGSGLLKSVFGPGPKPGSTRKLEFAFDNQGLLQSYTDVMGDSTAFHYDALHRLDQLTNPKQVASTWSYTDLNRSNG